jgi:hypothetical protein
MLAGAEKGISLVIEKTLGYFTEEFRIDVPRNIWACDIVHWNLG